MRLGSHSNLMQLNASILLKSDRTVLGAHFHVPMDKSHGLSLIDQILRNLPKNTNSATLQVEDFQIAYEHPILILAQAPANARLLISCAQQLSREINLASDPFESLFLLQESLFSTQISVQQRIKMHSEVEEKYILEQKRKLEEANQIRKLREAEIKKSGPVQGHGIDEHTLRELRQRAVQQQSGSSGNDNQQFEPVFKRPVVSDDSDDSEEIQSNKEQTKPETKKKVQKVVIKKNLKKM